MRRCFLSLILVLPLGCGPDDDKDTGDDTPDSNLLAPDDLLVSTYDNTIWVVDVTDPANASFVARAAMGDSVTSVDWPALNYNRTKFYFAQPDGIWGCDAPRCDNKAKVTPDWPGAIFNWFDVSPVDDTLVFEVWENYGAGENDIYTMKADGSDLTRVLAVEEEFPILPNNDQMGYWAAGEVAFSPDGTQIAVDTCGHCGSPDEQNPAPCFNDFYSVIYTMNVDGSGRSEAAWTIGECYYSELTWGADDALYYFSYDDARSIFQVVRNSGGTETVLGGETLEDVVTMRSSPDAAAPGLFVNPWNSVDARYHPINADTIGAGTTIQVPSPDDAATMLGVFTYFRWQH